MKAGTMEILLFLFINFVFAIKVNAQYSAPYVTIDKDGYTNIREQPNVKSKIVGKVYKYQVFYFMGDCDDSPRNYLDSNWLPISTDTTSGYVYKKNILQLDKLPIIKGKRYFATPFEEDSIICSNDSLKIIMKIRPFDKQNHNHNERIYGTEDGKAVGIEKEIKEIKIINRNQNTILPHDQIKNYCDPHTILVCIGLEGELYLYVGGGYDAGQYKVWLSIVDGNIVYNSLEDYCW